PDGLRYLRDGRVIIVANGVAIELAPVAADLVGFTAALQKEGFDLTLRNSGAVDIRISPTERFVGVFAYDNLVNANGACGEVTIAEPTGAVNDPGYVFGVHCDTNGVTQRVVPYVQDQVFYRALVDMGLTVTTDRNTGIISIPGVGSFKPGYFVVALSANDQAYLNQYKDGRGVAFRFVDLTGNGAASDVLFYTSTGVQAIYHVSE